jgi:hypothetical protein
MYDSVCLAGQVILIVEDDRGPFAQQLRAALDWVGARTLLARTPAHARDYVASIDLSAATIYSDGVTHSVEFPQLVKEMGSMPVLLYGAEPPPHQPFKNARFLAASKPSHTGAIVAAVTRLLPSSAPSPSETIHAEFSLSGHSWSGVRVYAFGRGCGSLQIGFARVFPLNIPGIRGLLA